MLINKTNKQKTKSIELNLYWTQHRPTGKILQLIKSFPTSLTYTYATNRSWYTLTSIWQLVLVFGQSEWSHMSLMISTHVWACELTWLIRISSLSPTFPSLSATHLCFISVLGFDGLSCECLCPRAFCLPREIALVYSKIRGMSLSLSVVFY